MLKSFRARHFRKEDGERPQGEIDEAVGKRTMNGDIKKFLIALVMILLTISGFFVTRMIGSNDQASIAQAAEIKAAIGESKTYSDSLMETHIKSMSPYLEQLRGQEATIKQIGHDVQRITDFMEFKFGMPHDIRRKNKLD